MKIHSIFFLLGVLTAVSGCGIKAPARHDDRLFEAWNSQNDPLRLDAQYTRRFSELPKEANLEVQPWSDSYWPTYKGGIAYRWQTSETPFSYENLTPEAISKLSVEQLQKLSPAEKFDIYRSDYSLSTVSAERSRTSPEAENWEGLCHGWAPAAYLYAEPHPVTLRNAEGLSIPFGSADIKALLTYFVAEYSNYRVRFLGTRCNVDLTDVANGEIPSECRDINAGAFHVVIANQLGLLRQSFVADVTRDLEVWNQPVHSFKTTVLSEHRGASPGAAPGTTREISLRTVMGYTVEIQPLWEPVVNSLLQSNDYREYNYRVEINRNGDIIGGEWLSEEEDRPDFLWIQDAGQFYGMFISLKEIYEASLAVPHPEPESR
jgi:hypothetical protein